jgi:hypothetical protein
MRAYLPTYASRYTKKNKFGDPRDAVHQAVTRMVDNHVELDSIAKKSHDQSTLDLDKCLEAHEKVLMSLPCKGEPVAYIFSCSDQLLARL